MAEFIAESPRLLRLDLRENEIKTGGLMALSLALKVNTSLLRLDLDREPKRETVSMKMRCRDGDRRERRLRTRCSLNRCTCVYSALGVCSHMLVSTCGLSNRSWATQR